MLGPLLYLGALIALTNALSETFSENQQFEINSCPLTYYQQSYSTLYVDFTETLFTICFDGNFSPQTQDCMCFPKPSNGQANYTLLEESTTYESTIHENVPTILNSMSCAVRFDFEVDGNKVAVMLASFGPETSLEFFSDTSDQTCEIRVSGGLVEKLSCNPSQPSAYTDISGCRMSGGGIKPNDFIIFPTTCTTASCSNTKSLTITGCDDLEECNGNNVCLLRNTCTVTGPTIIDIHDNLNSVGDRCVYSLMSGSDFDIKASFRERRRMDVSFLDSLTLWFNNSNTKIYLGQGGEIRVNDKLVAPNNTEINGIMLTEDQTGINVKATVTVGRFSAFFDGNMAQIHIEGPVGSTLSGLCMNSSSFSSAKLLSESSSGCETLYTEAPDSKINCPIMSERCNLLRDPTFSSYNAVIDPAPYIAACNETLCRYPAVDDLRCQFLWAYARACSLRNNALEDWWSKAACSPRNVLCQDKVCSDHEFCSTKLNGQPDCFCRALFASSYKDLNTLANPTMCSHEAASISLVGCLLVEKNIDYSHLHLNNETCKGQLDPKSGMVTFSFSTTNPCGAKITHDDPQITYKNTIRGQDDSSSVIYRRDQFNIEFSCIFTEVGTQGASFTIKDSTVVHEMAPGNLNYSLALMAYTDKEKTHVVDDINHVTLNEKLYLYMDAVGLNSEVISIVIDSCWATNTASFNSTPKHDLILNGCPNPDDGTVEVMTNGNGTSCSFCFNMFQFIGHSGNIYLHCKMNLCPKRPENNCAPNCSPAARRRRSVHPSYVSEASVTVTMTWKN